MRTHDDAAHSGLKVGNRFGEVHTRDLFLWNNQAAMTTVKLQYDVSGKCSGIALQPGFVAYVHTDVLGRSQCLPVAQSRTCHSCASSIVHRDGLPQPLMGVHMPELFGVRGWAEVTVA